MAQIEYNFTNGIQIRGLFEKQSFTEQETGVIVFVGRQGQGKTTSLFEYVRKYKKRYPECDIYSNMPCNVEGVHLFNAKEIYELQFDRKRQNLVIIDEISTIFSALSSTRLEQDPYQAFCQLRKRGCLIVSTAQRFDRITTALREQCNLIVDCKRFGRLQWCKVYNLEESNDLENPKPCYFYAYFPTNKTYELFDSYHIIKNGGINNGSKRDKRAS